VVEVGAGYWFACARTAERRIFCWGDNRHGQLGSLVSVNTEADGLPPDYRDSTDSAVQQAAYEDLCFQGGRCSPVPTEVDSPHRWSALAVGQEHACALAEDGGVYCWGGTDPRVLARDGFPMTCVNRSSNWPNERCQPRPVRIGGLPILAPPSQTSARAGVPATRDPLAASIVEVSRWRAEIAFSADTTGRWGWAGHQAPGSANYVWNAVVTGIDGPTTIMLAVFHRDSSARTFGSLAELITAGKLTVCPANWVQPTCATTRGVRSSVEKGRVVFTLRDSTVISHLFGTRPDSVALSRQSGWDGSYESASVAVRYVDPQIPRPSAELLARAKQGQRRHRASITSVGRDISASRSGLDLADPWISVGDSIELRVQEVTCHYDNCGLAESVENSGWQVKNERIVLLRQTCGRGCVVAHGLRPGTTVIAVKGLHSPSDTVPSREPPPRRVERKITVGPQLGRIAIEPRPDTVVVGQSYLFGAKAFDRAGHVVPGVPVEIVVDIGHRLLMPATRPSAAEFPAPGKRSVVASFRGLADTLVVTVVGKKDP
jgi:hypothetical protein